MLRLCSSHKLHCVVWYVDLYKMPYHIPEHGSHNAGSLFYLAAVGCHFLPLK